VGQAPGLGFFAKAVIDFLGSGAPGIITRFCLDFADLKFAQVHAFFEMIINNSSGCFGKDFIINLAELIAVALMQIIKNFNYVLPD